MKVLRLLVLTAAMAASSPMILWDDPIPECWPNCSKSQ